MREKKKTFFCALFFLTFLPFSFTMVFQGMGEVPFLATEISLQVAEKENQQAKLQINTPKTKKKLLSAAQKEQEDNRLLGILANQISATAPLEAVKAQAVIARTEVAYAENEKVALPQGRTIQQLHKIWGAKYEENRAYFEQAIQETEHQILIHEGKPVNAAYHAVSAGQTRALESEGEYAYLTEAKCPLDAEAPGFIQVLFYATDDICQKIQEKCSDCDINNQNLFEKLKVKKRDAAQYVTQLQVGKKSVTGEEFRTWLSLPSSCFYLSKKEGKLRIVTKGIGHGFGLSQYTAMCMAQEGSNYKEILNYFYVNIGIKEKNM